MRSKETPRLHLDSALNDLLMLQQRYPFLDKTYDIAIDAVLKQIKKFPDKVGNEYFCHRCGNKVGKYEHHCECGQGIDWRDE